MKKSLIIIGIIIVVVIILVYVEFKPTRKPSKELALEYLNNTYSAENDNFTFLDISFDLFPGWNNRYRFKSEKYDSDFYVTISESNNEYQFYDGYWELYMYDDAKLYFQNTASNLNNCEVKFRFGPNRSSNSYSTFAECKDDIAFDVFYFTNYDIEEQQKQEILNGLIGNTYRYVYFMVTTDINLVKDIELDTILNNQNQYIKSKSKYDIYEKNIEKIN